MFGDSSFFNRGMLLSLMLAAGCSAPPEPESPPPPPPTGTFKETPKGLKYKIYEAKNLPKLTTAVNHFLADPRINPIGPENWKEIPATQLREDQVLGFYRYDLGGPPNIVIQSASWVDHGIPQPASENLDAFFEIVSKKMESDLGKNEPLIEDLKLLLINGRPWVRCVRHFTFSKPGKGTEKGERQLLRTVEGSRVYTVELRVALDKIMESRDEAYSIAATLFDKPADKPAEKPADPPMPAKEAEKGK